MSTIEMYIILYKVFQGFCGYFVFFLSCVCCAFVLVCLYVPCGHLLGKGLPLGSRMWCLAVSLSLSHWYPGSGVVLDLSIPDLLHPYLLYLHKWFNSLRLFACYDAIPFPTVYCRIEDMVSPISNVIHLNIALH